MASRRRNPANTIEETSVETMNEELQPLTEESTESPVEIVPVAEPIPATFEKKRERTPLAPKPVRLHPRNIPRFSGPRGVI
jgi:hypothetical protein